MNKVTHVNHGEGPNASRSSMYEIDLTLGDLANIAKMGREAEANIEARRKQRMFTQATGMSDKTLENITVGVAKPESAVITSKPRTYTIEGELGRGTWGRVFSAKDQFGEKVAIKRLEPTELARQQMARRNLNPWKVMNNEAMTLAQSACANVVPRRIEVGEDEEPYIVMPQYTRFLSDMLRNYDHSRQGRTGLDLRRVKELALGIANGLREIHTVLGRHYGDLKPDNVAIDDAGVALINDLGTTSMGRSISPRDHIGFEYARAPEDWVDGGQLSKASDSYSFGCLFYRLLTGHYPNQDKTPQQLNEYFRTTPAKKIDKETWKKIKEEIPSELRKFVRKCTHADPTKRFSDASEMKTALEKAFDEEAISGHVRKAKPWAWATLAAAAFASLAYYRTATYEPEKLNMPQVYEKGKSPGLLYMNKGSNKELEFDAETIVDLPRIPPARGMAVEGIDRRSKNVTDNRIVAYLTKAEAYAFWSKDKFVEPTTEAQQGLYRRLVDAQEIMRAESLHGPVYPVVAKSIEYALTKSLRPDGKVDLEDTIAIARLGEETVKLAKERARSDNFSRYRYAKLEDGSFIIPEKEQRFLGLWLYYAKNDVDLIGNDKI